MASLAIAQPRPSGTPVPFRLAQLADAKSIAAKGLWTRYEVLKALACAIEDERVAEAVYKIMDGVEDHIFNMPCDSAGAAVAKCRLVETLFERGERSDEADRKALLQVVAWLEKQ